MNKTHSLSDEEILVKIIENDIYSGQLIYGLSDVMFIDANDYHLRLSDLVFRLFGFDRNETPETISNKYFILVREASLQTLGTNWKKVPENALIVHREMKEFIDEYKS